MKVYYKIVSKDESENSIVVRFWTDDITEEFLSTVKENGVIVKTRTDCNLNLPIPTPIGSELESFILRYVNVAWFEMMGKAIKGEIDLSYIDTQINIVKCVEVERAVITK